MVQWLGLLASTAGGMGSIPGQGTKILHAVWCSQNKTKQNQKQNQTVIVKNPLVPFLADQLFKSWD